MSYAIIMMLLRFKIIFQEDLHMATISRGIKAPIIREGDDIVSIVCDCVLSASKEQGFTLRDRDVVAVTEAVVARAAGNYATIDAIAEDVRPSSAAIPSALYSPYSAATGSPSVSGASPGGPGR